MGLRRAKAWPNKNLDCLFAGCKAEKYENYVLFGVWNVLVWLSIYPVCEMAERGYERRKGLEIPSEEACEQRSRQ
ncbi:MAG: hypothetical protein J6C12_08360 [Lachnospiraceae bacterium]|nr:hypothetical protein [Lachnospiraceae bacterium]